MIEFEMDIGVEEFIVLEVSVGFVGNVRWFFTFTSVSTSTSASQNIEPE
jgi:hypothetical protein